MFCWNKKRTKDAALKYALVLQVVITTKYTMQTDE